MLDAADGEDGLRLAARERARRHHPRRADARAWTAGRCCRRSRPTRPSATIPVIMLTMVDDRDMGFALGAADYLTKPIDREAAGRAAAAATRRAAAARPVLVVEDDAATREMLRAHAGAGRLDGDRGRQRAAWASSARARAART